MRFDITQLTTYFPGQDPPLDVYVQQILDDVALAEELGFECWWFTEHHFIAYGGAVANPAVMLAAAAARTTRIRLGSAISILPLHHPLRVAEDYAMVDVTSGGRLEFGIGRGNTPMDYTVFGIPPEESRARFVEATDLIVDAWSQERFSHSGTYWQCTDLALFPRPIQRPHPPIWVAGTSDETARWAGQRGYNIMTVPHPFPPERVFPSVEAWRAELAAAGHDPAARHNMAHVRVWVDETAERARAMMEPAIARYEHVSEGGRLGVWRPAEDIAREYDWAGMQAQGRNIYGTPDDVIGGIEASRRNYGFDILGAQFKFGAIPHDAVQRSMRLFAKEVMPAFR